MNEDSLNSFIDKQGRLVMVGCDGQLWCRNEDGSQNVLSWSGEAALLYAEKHCKGKRHRDRIMWSLRMRIGAELFRATSHQGAVRFNTAAARKNHG